jgi:FixJ family two-component response regulator
MLNHQPLIAVVDDDAPVRTSLRRLLRSSGFAVATFESGDAFLDTLPAAGTEGAPDCLVLDLHMPGRNGYDILVALLTAHRNIPTIVITGKEEPGTAERVQASGAVGFLTKPFDESDLLTVVRRSLTSSETS